MHDKPVDRVNNFNYIGCIISMFENKDSEMNLSKFNHIRATIKGVFNERIGTDTRIKFYKTLVSPTWIYSRNVATTTKIKAETKFRNLQKLNLLKMWQNANYKIKLEI